MNRFRHVTAMVFATLLPVAADWQPLWPGEAPGAPTPAAFSESEGEGGRLTDIVTPQYRVFLPRPSERTGAAVVILPGGGYSILAMNHEGVEYAEWLTQRGIVAVLLKYRVSGRDEAGYGFPVPLLDARRALRLTRSMARDWGVDPNQVGVMGSSAGGHLAAMCATLWSENFPAETDDPLRLTACRPDFAILVYPVISMAEPWGHGGSRRRLLGAAPDPDLVHRASPDQRVDGRTPPCFLVHAADDKGVPARNSLEFAARCAENDVPVTCHLLPEGGHGFGLRGKGESANWPTLLENWLVAGGLAIPPGSDRRR